MTVPMVVEETHFDPAERLSVPNLWATSPMPHISSCKDDVEIQD
jgi:hypothetical protein